MTRRTELSARKIQTASQRGLYGDGGGLYLQVSKLGYKSWVFRFRLHRKLRTMGLGAFPKVSLREARELRDAAGKLLRSGVDPILARGQRRHAAAASMTVEQAAKAYLEVQRPKWQTAQHADQVEQRLRNFLYPIIGHLPIADIKLAEVKQVLSPIWLTKNPTAGRVRQYLEDVINWAIAEGIRADESNPAEIKRLQYSLPIGIHKVRHFTSLPYNEVPHFLVELRKQNSRKARALELIVLTAVRVADVTGGGKAHATPMLWDHVDLGLRTWTVPDTKMGRPHTVPLSDSAMRLLAEMQRSRDSIDGFVFPGAKSGTATADATLRQLLMEMGYGERASVHGFRATFRTWASETTDYPKDVIEAALAHAQGELDAAYHRGSYLDKRRLLMQHWADFLEGRTTMHGAEVIEIRR